jgi:hypothetical protein
VGCSKQNAKLEIDRYMISEKKMPFEKSGISLKIFTF